MNSDRSSTPSAPTTTAQLQQPIPQAVQPPVEKTPQIYWLKSSGDRIELVATPMTLKGADKSNESLEAAFNSLLAGPDNPAFVSTIPKGTKLRSVKILRDGIHIDLSKEFTSGGGTASMTGRLAQVIYTATSLDPNANVWIDVEGQKLSVLGGEGIEVDQPLTRNNFAKDFSL
jgi:spore germination protein GerM